MAYNPNSVMEKIYNFKKMWSDAAAKGDESGKNNAATKAQEYYASLRDNGYGDVANKLSASGLDQSRKYIDNFYAMSGRQQTRPYFYGKGHKYGLSQSDIDKALSFNETTGEVSLGGKNIGRPAAISSDGYSYYDSDTLDKAWEDYAQTAGLTKATMKDSVQRATDNLLKMGEDWNDTHKQDYNDYMSIVKQDPFSTDSGKQIMNRYGLMGYTGRQNALANGAASNGGNVDSYSAANAMRQQAALNSMGQQAVMDMYNSKVQAAAGSSAKLEGARQLLAQLGVNINDAVANNETMLNGEVDRSEKVKDGQVDRDVKTAAVTGTVPKNMDYSNNPFFDNSGKLINPTQDYAEIIQNAQEKLKTTTNAQEIADLEETIRNARQARVAKVYGNYGDYSQYANTLVTPSARQTEDARQFDAAMQNSLDVLKVQNQQEADMANLNSQNAIEQANAASQNAINEANNATDNAIRANTAATNDSIRVSKETSGKDNTGDILTETQIEGIINNLNNQAMQTNGNKAIEVDISGKPKIINAQEELVAHRIEISDLTDEQKDYLYALLGIPEGTITTVQRGNGYNRNR